jgi:NAD(P) transhydrogenase subunit alpha
VVITTAAIPGRQSPILVTAEMVSGMAPGSVIVDLAAERGGNCEPTEADKTVVTGGVTILGPTNASATVPYHASQMFSRNMSTFLLNMVKDGQLDFDMEDEIIRDTMVTRDGEIVNARIRDLLKLGPLKIEPLKIEPTAAETAAESTEAKESENDE